MNHLIDFANITNGFEDTSSNSNEIAIPSEILSDIFKIINESHGFLLIENFPLNLNFYLKFMSCLGNPVPQDALGTIMGEVKLEFTNKFKVPRGHKSNEGLAFHNDRCDIIGLLCASEAYKGGATKVVQIEKVYNHIKHRRPDLLNILMKDFYFDLRDDRTGSISCYKMPVFIKNESGLIIRYIRKFIESAQQFKNIPRLLPIQIQALDYLDSTLATLEYQHIFELKKNDLLIINNFKTLHARSSFTNSASRKRLLYRVWLSNPKIAALPNSIKPLFGNDLNSNTRGGFRNILKKDTF